MFTLAYAWRRVAKNYSGARGAAAAGTALASGARISV
jgi:hypothetical protein